PARAGPESPRGDVGSLALPRRRETGSVRARVARRDAVAWAKAGCAGTAGPHPNPPPPAGEGARGLRHSDSHATPAHFPLPRARGGGLAWGHADVPPGRPARTPVPPSPPTRRRGARRRAQPTQPTSRR